MTDKELYDTMFHILNESSKWNKCAKIIENASLSSIQYTLNITLITAFCCELLLKGILIYEKRRKLNDNEEHHNLVELYNCLSANSKLTIKKYTKWKVKKMPNNSEQKFKNIKKFGGWLEQLSNYYCELRYNYEQYGAGKSIYVCKEDIDELYIGLLKYYNDLYAHLLAQI